jgi:hypothetical protein
MSDPYRRCIVWVGDMISLRPINSTTFQRGFHLLGFSRESCLNPCQMGSLSPHAVSQKPPYVAETKLTRTDFDRAKMGSFRNSRH